MLLVILLGDWASSMVVLPLRVPSCSPCWREFIHEFETLVKKGVKSLTLKELLPKYVSGKSNS